MSDIHRRLGRFAIAFEIIERNPQIAQAIMARCIVVRAESMYDRRAVEYTAISSDFAPLSMGVATAEYDVLIEAVDGGEPRISFRPKAWRA